MFRSLFSLQRLILFPVIVVCTERSYSLAQSVSPVYTEYGQLFPRFRHKKSLSWLRTLFLVRRLGSFFPLCCSWSYLYAAVRVSCHAQIDTDVSAPYVYFSVGKCQHIEGWSGRLSRIFCRPFSEKGWLRLFCFTFRV